MAVMRGGEFVQVGTPEEVLANPADEYVERFVDGARAPLAAGAGRGGQGAAVVRPTPAAENVVAEKPLPVAKPRRLAKKVGATRAV